MPTIVCYIVFPLRVRVGLMRFLRLKQTRIRIYSVFSVWCILVLALGYALPAYAQADTITLAAAEAIAPLRVVRATAVAPLQVLQGDALRRVSGLGVADALRHFSGLQIKDYGGVGGLKTINVRSLGTHHTAVSLDGVALHNAQNGQIDLGRFALDDLEAVAVGQHTDATQMTSASSLLSAAQVQLHSRRPQFAVGQRHWQQLGVSVGSFGTYMAQLRHAARLSARSRGLLSLAGLTTTGRYGYRYRVATPDGRTANDTAGTRLNGDVRYLRAEANYYLTPTPSSNLAAKAYLYTSARGLPGAVVRGLPTHADRQWDTNLALQATYRQALNATWAWHTIARLAHDHLRYRTDPEREGGVMHVDNRYRQSEAYASALLRGQWQHAAEHTLSLGVDGRVSVLRSNMAGFVRPTRQHYVAALAYRYQRALLTLDAHATWGFVKDHTALSAPQRASAGRASGAAALAYQPTPQLTLRLLAKHSYRLPTLNDLYYAEIGNSNLRVERVWQLGLGADYRMVQGWLVADFAIDAYAHRVSDKIVAVPTSNQFRWTMMNLGRVRILGSELRATLTPRHVLGWQPQLRLSYTYQHATDRTAPSTIYYGHQIAYIPHHAATATLQLARQAWWASLAYIYTGTRYDQQTNTAENFVPAWYTTDLALGYTAPRWRATAELNNLFNQRYEIVKGYPLPGTNLRFVLHYTL